MAVTKKPRGPVSWLEETAKLYRQAHENTLYILEFQGGWCLLLEMAGQGGMEVRAEGTLEECKKAAEEEMIWVYDPPLYQP